MISNLTETIMCLIEETGDSTHERTGRGELGAATFLPSPSLPKFWATQKEYEGERGREELLIKI